MSKKNEQVQEKIEGSNDAWFIVPSQSDLEKFSTTSGKIRYLASTGMSRGDIAKKLNIRYQHVRNVLITPIKK